MKVITVRPSIAVKAERGTVSLWTKDGCFGAGTQPQANKKNWPMHLLADTAAGLLWQGFTLSINQHD